MPLQAEGEFAQVKNRLERALALSGQPVKRGTMAHLHIVYMMLVDTAAIAEDAETILKYAPMLEELATRDRHEPYLAISMRARGIAYKLNQEFEQAENYFQQALTIFEKLGMSWQKGRTLYELGNLALRKGETGLSQEWYLRAQEVFAALDADPELQKTKQVLDRLRTA